MADLAADLTNDNSRFEAVLFQRNKIIVDGEINEVGRLGRVRDYRLMRMATNNSGQVADKNGRAMALNIEVIPGDDPGTVVVKSLTGFVGLIAFRGYIFELTSPVVLTGVHEVPLVLEEYQIYVRMTEVEISAADDPTIKINQLGETTRRTKLMAQILLGGANTGVASVGHTATELYETPLSAKSALLALVRRQPGVDPTLEPYQIYTQYIPVAEFEQFRIANTYLCRSNEQVPATTKWNGVDFILTVTNVALVVVGTWADEGSAPLKIELPATVTLPALGDALVVYVPPFRRSATPGFDNTHALASLTPDMYSLKATVENIDNYSRGFVDITDQEDSFSGRVVVAVRISDTEVLFRNNRMVRYNVSIKSHPGEGLVSVVDDRLMMEYHEKGDIPAFGQDRIPYTHSRYVSLSDYNLIHSYREQDLNGLQVFVRMYIAKTPLGAGYAITRNAKWLPQVGPQWQADDKDTSSFIVRFGAYTALASNDAQIQFGQKRGNGTLWNDEDWDLLGDASKNALYHFAVSADGRVSLPDTTESLVSGIRQVQFTGTDDPASPGAYTNPNSVGAALVCKAWGVFRFNGGVITILDSFGISGIASVGTDARVTLSHAMANANYSVVLSSRSVTPIDADYIGPTTTTFDIVGTTKAGAAINLAGVAADNTISFQVFGRQ